MTPPPIPRPDRPLEPPLPPRPPLPNCLEIGGLHSPKLRTLVPAWSVCLLHYQVSTHSMVGLTRGLGHPSPEPPNAPTYDWFPDRQGPFPGQAGDCTGWLAGLESWQSSPHASPLQALYSWEGSSPLPSVSLLWHAFSAQLVHMG
ncbi:hypothetical protein DSO57_1018371 [Entomophthora muscae]|uniref:Uncharacterized protein n=1 Tax=Entomophthora muscae TaxID=34485 RepID=A0ACC2T4D3_9FUNG|nr:hypothetical protein DSO57_1018371 [Entomophthora muscae]